MLYNIQQYLPRIQQKKGIVLVITLAFIIALSFLIEKSLETNERFLKVVANDAHLQQLQLSVRNLNDEIIEIFKENGNTFVDDLPPVIPINYGNVSAMVSLERLEPFFPMDYQKLQSVSGDEFEGSVEKEKLLEIIKDKNITNQLQIDSILDEYVSEVGDDQIYELRDSFVYGNLDRNNTGYIRCSYDIKIEDLEANVVIIFDGAKGGGTRPLQKDIRIKR